MNNELNTVTTISCHLLESLTIPKNCTGVRVQLHLPLDLHTQIINTNRRCASTLKETWLLTISELPWSLVWSRYCHYIEINVTALSICYILCFQILLQHDMTRKSHIFIFWKIMFKTHRIFYFTVFMCWLHFCSDL